MNYLYFNLNFYKVYAQFSFGAAMFLNLNKPSIYLSIYLSRSYFPRYTLLSESVISKDEISNYQLLRDFDRTENAESALSKIFDLRYLRNCTFTT